MAGGRDTDELTQDVFVRVWQKLGTFRGDSAFSTWLHRLAVNVVIERFRTETARRQRLREGDDIFDTIAAPRAIPGPVDGFREPRSTKLPDGAREIFVLHDVEGYKHHEIAIAARHLGGHVEGAAAPRAHDAAASILDGRVGL